MKFSTFERLTISLLVVNIALNFPITINSVRMLWEAWL